MRHFALFIATLAVLGAVIATPAQSKQYTSSKDVTAPPDPAMDATQKTKLRADILMARKEYAAAIDLYLAVLKDTPKDANLLNKLGVAYQQLGANDTSASFYKRAEKADKKMASPVNNLGTLEYGLKHYSKAVNYYKRAINLGGEQATLYSNLGYAYFAEKKLDLAMESFTKAVALDPTVFENHSGQGGSVMQQRSAPDPGTLNFLLAKTYAKSGNGEQAAHYLKLARDYGYKDLLSANKDKDFALVIKDSRVQDVLQNRPSYTDADSKAAASNPSK